MTRGWGAALGVGAALVPTTALADNCSGLSDCWSTVAAAVLVTVAVAAVVAIGIALLPALAVEAAEIAEVAEIAGEAAEVGEAVEGDLFAKEGAELAAELSAEAYGPAIVNDAAEYQAIMGDLEGSGVEVNLNSDIPLGQGSYGPGSPGSPGTLTVNPDVDISTLGHEYEHFVMDRELGYPGIRGYMEDPQLLVDGEIRAYNTEITRAEAAGNSDLADALRAALRDTVDRIKGDYGL